MKSHGAVFVLKQLQHRAILRFHQKKTGLRRHLALFIHHGVDSSPHVPCIPCSESLSPSFPPTPVMNQLHTFSPSPKLIFTCRRQIFFWGLRPSNPLSLPCLRQSSEQKNIVISVYVFVQNLSSLYFEAILKAYPKQNGLHRHPALWFDHGSGERMSDAPHQLHVSLHDMMSQTDCQTRTH